MAILIFEILCMHVIEGRNPTKDILKQKSELEKKKLKIDNYLAFTFEAYT